MAPMLSLDSDREESALRRFDERVRKLLGDDIAYVVEPKFDGASVELVYENGTLVRASTRGNGQVGEGITDNVRTIRAVPLMLRGSGRKMPLLLAVRVEVIMRIAAFEELNERLMGEGREPFANPRNAAAGGLRQLDPQATAQRPLDIFAYEILSVEGASVGTQMEALDALRNWGFPTSDLSRRVEVVDEILEYHHRLYEQRDDLDYEIDGVVIKLDDLAARKRVGATSHHPRWAYAYKFAPRKEVTRVVHIVPSVGRTGVITPIAMLRPVELGGVTVSRASLHNREEVVRKDIRDGDLVRVQRAGDVIPQVVERVPESGRRRGPPFQMPDRCPSCGTAVVERGPFTVCPNSFECPLQLAGRIQHFASREALDIDGLGEESAKLFVREGLVRRLPDLFEIAVEDLLPLEGFARKSAENLVAAVGDAAHPELHRFLFGLGIPEVGVAVARDLAQHFGSLEAIAHATGERLEEVEGVGPKMAEQISGFFRDPRNRDVLEQLLDGRVRVREAARSSGQALAGTKVVFTGGLEQLTRREAQQLVRSLGGRATSSVSKDTDYVIVGRDPSSKADKARKLGVPMLTEEEFLELLRSHGVEI